MEAGCSSAINRPAVAVAEKNRGGSRGVRGAGDGVVEAEAEFSSRRARTSRTVVEVQVHACARGALEREAALAQRLVLLKRFA